MRPFLPALALFATLLCGCQTVFLTERDQFDLIPEDQEIALGTKAYQDILDTEPKSQNAHLSQMVERVGQRIAAVSERSDYEWEFVLLARPTQNAFCLPGGKVAIYEGILPICENEAGLAVVMSHEIAHAIARHGGERMSHQMAAEGGEWALSKILGHRDSKRVEMIKSVYGIGTEYGVLLPFSRTQESEADAIGLTLMARAGYDPQEAPRFWERFSSINKSNVPELLSTHPSDEKRMAQLKELVPRALAVYQSAAQRYGLAEQIPMTALTELHAKPVVEKAQKPADSPVATALAATPAPVAPASATPATTPPAPAAPAVETTGVSVTVAPVVKIEAAKVEPAVSNSIGNLGAPTVDASATPTSPVVQASAEEPAKEVAPNAEASPPASAPVTPPAAAPIDAVKTDEPAAPPADAPLVAPDEWTPHEQ